MSQIVYLNSIPYVLPVTGETGWGNEVTDFLTAVAGGGLLQLQGGAFTLRSELNVGPNYGIASPYIKSGSTLPATTGLIRLSTNEAISWRNAANTADLPLTVDASGNLLWQGFAVSTLAGVVQIANGGTGKTTAPEALNALAPSQVSQAGKYLYSDGTNITWNTSSATTITVVNVPTTTVLATAGSQYVLTNIAATTITLPATPVTGDIVQITIANQSLKNTIARNGQTIEGLAEDMTLNIQYGTVQLRFVNNTWSL
jgi:hypothetical protein